MSDVIHWLPDSACPAAWGEHIMGGQWQATTHPEKVTCEHCDLSITPEQEERRKEALDVFFASALAAYAPQPADAGSQGDAGGEVAGDATTPCEVHQGVFDAITFEPRCSVCGLPQVDYVMREVGTNERGERLVVPVLTETPGTWVFGDTKETL
jgi:hypothetical protein